MEKQAWYKNFGVVIFSGFLFFVIDFFAKNYAIASLSERWTSFGPMRFHFVANDQLAFSIPVHQGVIIALATFVLIALLQYFAVCVRDGLYGNLWAANFVIWGAFSNLYDRISRGFVVDYIHLGAMPVFNLSDIAIIGGLFALLIMVKEHEKQLMVRTSHA